MQAVESKYRPDLETPTQRIAPLPVHRGYPVPWFVGWVNGEPEFRAMDGEKFVRAIRERLCWVCGQTIGSYGKREPHPVYTFVAGPMCGINRTSAEPPCHLECARWSARNCPFLSKPHMVRRENDLPDHMESPGHSIRRNPGVSLLWSTAKYRPFSDGKGGTLLNMGEPTALEWWAEGKAATRAQVVASVESGLPILMEIARQEAGAVEDLLRRKAWLEMRYPA